MENENQDFEQLKKLLALKKHEQPPPGYFNKFSGNVISRLRAERAEHANSMHALEKDAPWLLRFWRMLETRPMLAGTFGAAVCGLVLFGIVLAEKPDDRPNLAGTPLPTAPALNNAPSVAGTGAGEGNQSVLLASNLFQMVPSSPSMPAGFNP